MQKSKNILRFFFGLIILFVIVFQSVHSILHISEHEFISVVNSDCEDKNSDSNVSFEWKMENKTEKCYSCSFFLSPFMSSDIIEFSDPVVKDVSDIQDLIDDKVTALNQVYFSLRAPPIYI